MIVIGDVHGQFDMLMRLLDKLPQIDDLCFVGDLIDRGPKSKEVIGFVRENCHKVVLGNHEDFVINDSSLWCHPQNGGMSTIESFGGMTEFLESGVIKWMNTLPIMIECDNFLITHSFAYNGINTPVDDLLWGREFNLHDFNPHSIKHTDFINIFGHTPVKNAQKIHGKHWDIDTGAAYGNKLSAIDLDDQKIYFVEG
jgi:serine/threonine protein phosphatase 1